MSLGVLGFACTRPLCPSDISPWSGGNPAPCPGHIPAFASLRVPFRFTKGDGGGFVVVSCTI